MNEKLKNHFLRIGPRAFVIATVLLLLALDILNGIYLKKMLENSNITEKMILLACERMQISPADLEPGVLTDMTGLLEASVNFSFLLILINNLFFYFFYLRKKLWAQGYVLFYAFTSALFSMLMIFENAEMGTGWLIFNFTTIPIYFYLYLGVKLLKNETTLVPKKKGR